MSGKRRKKIRKKQRKQQAALPKLFADQSFKGMELKFKGADAEITSCPPGSEMVQVTTKDDARYVVELHKIFHLLKPADRVKVLKVARAAKTTKVATFTPGDKKVVVETVDDNSQVVDVSEPGVEVTDIVDKTEEKDKKEEKEEKDTYVIPNPKITFSPYSWAKVLFLRKSSENEVGMFGIAETDNPLHITDVYVPKQKVSACTVEFEDESIADYFDAMVDRGLKPEQFARIWIHTHPGMAPNPSTTDEATFFRAFGKCNWAVMFIVGATENYARLQFNTGPKGSQKLSASVIYSGEFKSSDHAAWKAEYDAKVTEEPIAITPTVIRGGKGDVRTGSYYDYYTGYSGYEGYGGYPTADHPYLAEAAGGPSIYGEHGAEHGGFTDTPKDDEVTDDDTVEGDLSNVNWNAIYKYLQLPAWEIQILEDMDSDDDRSEFLYENYGIDVDEMMQFNSIPEDGEKEPIEVVDVLADELDADEAAVRTAYKEYEKKRRRETIEA